LFVRCAPLRGYRLDVAGSIAGVGVFTGLPFAGLPPVAWGLVAASFLHREAQQQQRAYNDEPDIESRDEPDSAFAGDIRAEWIDTAAEATASFIWLTASPATAGEDGNRDDQRSVLLMGCGERPAGYEIVAGLPEELVDVH
jgi:hypothetical protein